MLSSAVKTIDAASTVATIARELQYAKYVYVELATGSAFFTTNSAAITTFVARGGVLHVNQDFGTAGVSTTVLDTTFTRLTPPLEGTAVVVAPSSSEPVVVGPFATNGVREFPNLARTSISSAGSFTPRLFDKNTAAVVYATTKESGCGFIVLSGLNPPISTQTIEVFHFSFLFFEKKIELILINYQQANNLFKNLVSFANAKGCLPALEATASLLPDGRCGAIVGYTFFGGSVGGAVPNGAPGKAFGEFPLGTSTGCFSGGAQCNLNKCSTTVRMTFDFL